MKMAIIEYVLYSCTRNSASLELDQKFSMLIQLKESNVVPQHFKILPSPMFDVLVRSRQS